MDFRFHRRAEASDSADRRRLPPSRVALRRPRKRALYVVVICFVFGAHAIASTPLIDAVKTGDTEAVRRLLQGTIDVKAAEPDGTTALHWASYRDDLTSAQLLLRAGANPNAANDLGATPIWMASVNRSTAMVRLLLDAGANPNAALLLGETAVMAAARSGNADIVEQLLSRGANANARAARGQTALMWAVAQRHPEVVKVLIKHGADVHARSDTWTQIMAVSPHGHPEYNRPIPFGSNTPLMFAARTGDLESAKLLVAAGANVNDTDAWGVSAMALAAHSGFTDLVEFLLDSGANVNASGAGFTALHAAIMRRDERLVRTLLARGANPNLPLKDWTPTRRQASDFHFEPELVGATPFWLAARYTQPNVMRLLVERGADPLFVHKSDRVVDGRGGKAYEHQKQATTALMAAVGMGGGGQAWVPVERSQRESIMLETVTLALGYGIDINAANVDRRTALDAVKALKYERVAAYLVEKGAKPGVSPKPEAKADEPQPQR